LNINKVILQTSNLIEMKNFYLNRLQFEMIDSSINSFSIKVGSSVLEFLESSSEKDPYYHFAFNLPSNKFQEAKNWVQSKVRLLTEDGVDEIYFKFLDAHSFYFLDPSGNIVEFISRHSNSPESEKTFSIDSILNISEINVTISDVFTVGKQLVTSGIPVRNDEDLNEGLNFMGANGSFILLCPPERRWLFSDKNAEIHPVKITIDHHKIVEINDDGEFQINLIKY
jgi:catechol-2,3-dioxygenase